MITIEVKGRPPSLNKLYAGGHWRTRAKMAEEWHLIFLAAYREALLKPLRCPVALHISVYGVRRLDCDNAVVASKLAGDALVQGKYIPDDNPDYISMITLQSFKCKKGEEKTMIKIEEL